MSLRWDEEPSPGVPFDWQTESQRVKCLHFLNSVLFSNCCVATVLRTCSANYADHYLHAQISKRPNPLRYRFRQILGRHHSLQQGDVSRLKPLVERGTIGFFKWYLHSCAVNTSAEIQVSSTGEFEAEKPR